MYYIYILKCEDGSLYTGITNDLERRFKEHQNKIGGRYTSSHRPEKIVYTETSKTRSNALKCEAQIKSWPRKKKMVLINTTKNQHYVN
ncbi:GIY-YIG nuclease family protein [Candidatus Jorgensenbacteria bacterium]|nr:GIY-YIG nuclease family protein [Candidatus Jorgensenbacteria bacterium]